MIDDPDRPADDRRARGPGYGPRLAVVALLAAVLAAFLPVVDNGFVNYDDKKNFLENPSFRGLSRPQLAWAWTTDHLGVYQPVGWMLLEAQYAAWGLDPRGYHLASLALYILVVLALHALTVALVARGRPDLGRDDPDALRIGSCLAVGLYAVHPLRAEVVAWASCQPYLPCALFALLSILAYLRSLDASPGVHRGWMAGSLGLFGLSMLSKAAASGLPLVLLILDVYPLRRLGPGRWSGPGARRVYREKVPFVVLGAVAMGLALWARRRTLVPVAGHTFEARVAWACDVIWFHLAKTVVPVGLSACYPVPFRLTLADPRYALAALGVLAATAGLMAARRRYPAALAAWGVYLVMLAPSSGLIPKGGQYLTADRYGFLPLMGLVAPAAAALGPRLRRGRFPRPVAAGVLAAPVVAGLALVPLTRAQCRTWRTSTALWRHALAASTEPNPFACHSLGLALSSEPGTLAEAEAWIAEAARLVPDDPSVRNALTIVLARRGRTDEALAQALEALRLDPRNVHARVNLGNLLAMRGDLAGAAAAYEQVLRDDPANADAHGNLGLILLGQGRTTEGEVHLHQARLLNPGSDRVGAAPDDLQRRRDPPEASRNRPGVGVP